MSNAIVTLAVGSSPLWEVSHPLMATYAKRIGCDFIRITGEALEKMAAHSRKLEVANYLKTYERILFLDGDVIIHEDCPDLFDQVPANALGATVERDPFFENRSFLSDACELYGIETDEKRLEGEGWFNSGVMVISRCHAKMFCVPNGKQLTPCHGFRDQALLNATRILHDVPLYDLEIENNYIVSIMLHPARTMSPFDANIFHTTGFLHPVRLRVEFMRQFATFWKGYRKSVAPMGRIIRLRDRFFFLKVAMKCRDNPIKRWILYPIATIIFQILEICRCLTKI